MSIRPPDRDRSPSSAGRRIRRRLGVPEGFDFGATIYSHGWCVLAPYTWDATAGVLESPLRVPGGVARIAWQQPGGRGGPVTVEIRGGRGARTGLGSTSWAAIERASRRMLALDHDLTPFVDRCREEGGVFELAIDAGFGRLLRSPSLFDDVVKILATTNTTWGGTKAMIANLVRIAGSSGAFPSALAVARCGTERLVTEGRWGYRAAYLSALAGSVADGTLDLSLWEAWSGTTEELESEVRAVPGLGPYAAAHVLSLIGRYDRIGVDTVFRSFVKRRYFPRARKAVTDERMLAVYRTWGAWRGLAYWADLWYDSDS